MLNFEKLHELVILISSSSNSSLILSAIKGETFTISCNYLGCFFGLKLKNLLIVPYLGKEDFLKKLELTSSSSTLSYFPFLVTESAEFL
jgi:hypothetical protein